MRTIRLTILTLAILTGLNAATANAQIAGDHLEMAKQIPARLPKLALMGAVDEIKGGVQYHKIILTITNWEKYSPNMFALPTGNRPPGGLCGDTKSRIAVVVYSERGAPVSDCIPMFKPVDLSTFSFSKKKGSSVPQFVYAVMNDSSTGAVYRSNLVSPFGGGTK